jgi:D-sedoheptulose 7-phosphate isomerase
MNQQRLGEPTSFLYPFIDGDETDPGPLLADLANSALTKAVESSALRAATLQSCSALITSTGAEMARRFAAGGSLFTFGNGGSSTDAATFATLFAQPIGAQPLPAWSLTSDQAVLTALSNDVGFDLVFVRQLIARARANDIAVAMSTSGNSADLLLAMREAHHRGLYTIGFSGYDGGAFADNPDVDVCFVVRSQSVHRIQESQAMLGHQLWATVQLEMRRHQRLR